MPNSSLKSIVGKMAKKYEKSCSTNRFHHSTEINQNFVTDFPTDWSAGITLQTRCALVGPS
jgi:hypothetical protein